MLLYCILIHSYYYNSLYNTHGLLCYSYYSSDFVNINWGNTIISTRWNRVWNNTLFSNLSLTFSNYHFASIDVSNLNDFDLSSDELINRDITYQQFNSNIEDQAAKIDFEFSGWHHGKSETPTNCVGKEDRRRT